MKKTIILFIISLLILVAAPLFGERRYVVQTGHTGEVKSVDIQQSTGLLVSSGEDGILRVWRQGALLYSRQVSHLPLTDVRLHPDKPVAAFVATDNINTYRLIVYNWAERRELFSLRIDELPLSMGFSPRGRYLFYSRADLNSLSILDAENGAPEEFARSGFGIVSAAFISESESTIVSYLTSGSIIYWDLEADQRKAPLIPTVSNLELVDFNSTGRYGIGYRNDTLYLFDLVSGRTLDTISVPGIIDLSVHPERSSLALIRNTSRIREMILIDFSDRSLKESFSFSLGARRPLSIAYDDSGIVLGMGDGTVGKVFPGGSQLIPWGENRLSLLSDIDIWNGSLALSAPGRLNLFDSSSLRNNEPQPPIQMERTEIALPFSSSGGFLPIDRHRGVLWSSEVPGSAYLFSVSSGRFDPLFSLVAAGQEIYADNERLLSLDRNGSIILYSLEEEKRLYEYAASGIRDVTFIDHETILIGRNPSRRFPSPLMRINLRTGETVPLEANDLLTFALQYDPFTRSLYTLGLQERRGGIMTVLQQLRGENFQRSQPLLSFPGEDHSATFVLDSLRIYTSLGHSGVQVSGWEGFSNLDKVDHIPRKISVENSLLVSLNSDYSVSLWNKRSGSWLGDLYLFKDDEWLLIRQDSSLLSSFGGLDHLKSFEGEREVPVRRN